MVEYNLRSACVWNRNFFVFFVVIFLFNNCFSYSQDLSTSPFSRYGIGDLQNNGFAQNRSMAGLGTAVQSDTITPYNINLSNPASLAYNRMTTYEVGMNTNTSQLISNGQSNITSATSFAYMGLSFPVTRWWGSAISLAPMSAMGYNLSNTVNQDTLGPVKTNYIGSGGINKVSWSNGFRLKNLSLGFNFSYLFGGLFNERDVILPSSPLGYFNTQTITNINASDVYFDYGFQYDFVITHVHHRELRDNVIVVVGGTFAAAASIRVKTGTFTQSYVYDSNNQVTPKDTIENTSGVRSTFRLPEQFSGGISIKKGDRLMVGVQYSVGKWSEFELLGVNQGLANTEKFVLGGQFTPAHRTETNLPYFQRVTYRAGIRYQTLPLVLNGVQLPEEALTIGFGFPVGFNRHMSLYNMVNVGLEIGQRGTTATEKENFFNLVIGISINDRWFVKPKFD